MLGQARKMLKNQKGVTLVELLAVIIILGIIALIAVPAIAGVIDDSRESGIKASAMNYLEAAELYYITNSEDTDDFELSDLDSYIDDRGGVTWTDLSISLNGGDPTISGTGTDGDISVTFVADTIDQVESVERN